MIDSVIQVTSSDAITPTPTVISGAGTVQAASVFIDGLAPRLAYQFQPRPLGRPAPFKPGRAR